MVLYLESLQIDCLKGQIKLQIKYIYIESL